MLGFFLIAVPLLIAFQRRYLPLSWRRVCLAGGIAAAFLGFLGFLEAITYVLAADDPTQFFEFWEMRVVPVLAFAGKLTLIGFAVAVVVLYVRDYLNKTRYNWLHYVPLFVSVVGCTIGIVVQVGYVFASRL